MERKLVSNETIVIDVRNKSELISDGKIPNSINVPYPFAKGGDFALDFKSFHEIYGFNKPDKNDDIVVLCKSGKRGLEASKRLVKLGYENVKVYFGGIKDWKENGGKVIYEKGKILYKAFKISFLLSIFNLKYLNILMVENFELFFRSR